ncbi:hypothetical protein [Propionispora vibrioides]|uniref:hypothetical protein n=1 Tax=Propionispora vibrioides TaxID=112903 RepID=UPI00115F8F43|nr:hypothetical protein [Propionispora vibrioides]
MIKIDKKIIIIAALFLVIATGCWYLFGSGGNISNNGVGADQVRSDLSAVGQQQSAAIDGLGRIETGLSDGAAKVGTISAGLNDTTKSIAATESRIDASQNAARSSSELIAEGQRILGQVRERSKNGI